MRHDANAFMYENYKASEIGQEEEAKDAASIINVKLYEVAIFFRVTQLCCVNRENSWPCNWSCFSSVIEQCNCTYRKLIKEL